MNTDHPLLANDPKRNFYSLGYALQILQCLPGQLRVLMEDAQVEWHSTIDGVPYLDGERMQKVVDSYKRVANEIEAAQNAVQNN